MRLGLELYFNAFMDLTNSRNTGWNIGRIPWEAINEWGIYAELETDQQEDLLFLVQQMDVAYVKYWREKEK